MEKQENRADNVPTGNEALTTTDACAQSLTTPENGTAGDVDDLFANILSLKLKKPKRWKWELTTSRSCSSIAMPRIMLYNHKGDLLVDANQQQEQIFRQPSEPQKRAKNARKLERAINRAANVRLETAINKQLERVFTDLQAEGSLPSKPSTWPKVSARPDFLAGRHISALNTSHRANSCKEGHLNIISPVIDAQLSSITAITTPTASTIATSSSTSTRGKRRHRRSQSSLGHSSESILERQSLNRGQFTSSESHDDEVKEEPRYISTSKTDASVGQADSISQYRRPGKMCKLCNKIHYWLDEETSTTESSLMSSSSSIQLNGSIKSPPQQAGGRKSKQSINLRDGRADSLSQKTLYPRRRSRSSAILKLPQPSPSSSSATETPQSGTDDKEHQDKDVNKLLRRSNEYRRSKEGLVAINTKNEILVDDFEKETAR